MPALETAPDPELAQMTRRFWIAAALTLPLFVLAMGDMAGLAIASGRTRAWLELVLALPVATWAAWPFYERFARVAPKNSQRLNMFTLIGLGVGVAFGYSLVAVAGAEHFSHRRSSMDDGTVGHLLRGRRR